MGPEPHRGLPIPTFDVQFARNVLFEDPQAAAFGLRKQEALITVTINSAEVLSVGDPLETLRDGLRSLVRRFDGSCYLRLCDRVNQQHSRSAIRRRQL